MGALDGRVAIITGAGGGLGREHALLFATQGAKVVVNDLGGDVAGEGAGSSAAQKVVDEIVALGGEAAANTSSVADWDGAKGLVDFAIETFGDLHVLVNNAGILRDRVVANMTEREWDAVIEVHLKGHFCPTHHAAAYWRERAKAGHEVKASIIHTSSTSGVLANPGQANYGAAKAGIAALSTICAMELGRYGVRSNAITPTARTRMTEGLDSAWFARPDETVAFDEYHPGNVSPMVAYLATRDCPVTNELFYVAGDVVGRYQPSIIMDAIRNDGSRWTLDALASQVPKLVAAERRGGLDELKYVSDYEGSAG
jgi:NAD(P)-dependent dehydrogenase (short-subunit alcohol dehydrogenase family)